MLQFIMLIAPAVIATLLFDKLNPCNRTAFRYVAITLCFSFIINMLVYTAIWLSGYSVIIFTLDESLSSVAFCLMHMSISLVFACLLALIATGISKIKNKKEK